MLNIHSSRLHMLAVIDASIPVGSLMQVAFIS